MHFLKNLKLLYIGATRLEKTVNGFYLASPILIIGDGKFIICY